MKRLNKKGFTLVELLAVIVIMAILIAVVATTAIPAMNNARIQAAESYSERLAAKAKEVCLVDKLGEVSTSCTYPKATAMVDIMGGANSQYTVTSDIVVNIDDKGVATINSGEIQDKSNNIIDMTTNKLKTS